MPHSQAADRLILSQLTKNASQLDCLTPDGHKKSQPKGY